MHEWQLTLLWLTTAIVLVIANGFFVAAEFALVKIRPTRLSALVGEGRAFARTAQWLMDRLNESLSACQLGITMASLGLGWVGEPAVARLIEPVMVFLGVNSPVLLHTLAFVIAFTAITAAHLVIGEQAPKIFAIREPERMALWCAGPLKLFYIVSYPLLVALSKTTNALLRRVGVEADSAHNDLHTEEELQVLLSRARVHGQITRLEHRLITAVFEFDDTICRKVMMPRVDVAFFDVNKPFAELLEQARQGVHTRYPVCDGSMDLALGVVHIKDFIGLDPDVELDIRSVLRPPRYVPETMQISKLLAHFQAARQHMAFVVDEYGSVAGIVTLEDVLERIVGTVDDEFDTRPPDVVPDGPGQFIVQGSSPLGIVNRSLGTNLSSHEMDTISGLLMEQLGRVVETGDRVELDGVTAEVLEASNARAVRIRMIVVQGDIPKTTGALT